MAQGLISRRGAVIGSKAGGMFFGVELPRSLYYAQAAQWVRVTESSPLGGLNRLECVCGDELWILGGGHAYSVSLATGETTSTMDHAGFSFTWNQDRIDTDGEENIFFTRSYTSSYNACVEMLQFNVKTKSITVLGTAAGNCGYTHTNDAVYSGPLVYSKTHNAIYLFGIAAYKRTYEGSDSRRYVQQGISFKYDLTQNSFVAITGTSTVNVGGYGYSDETTGVLYFGGGLLMNTASTCNVNSNITAYYPDSNTYTAVKTDFNPNNNVWGGWYPLGDAMFLIDQAAVTQFNPKTGGLIEGEKPTAPGVAMQSGYRAVHGNTLCISADTGLYKCALYEDLPADAPTVCKIYKGQKFHTLVPFEIPAKNLTITTTPQTATEDIEIKMYDYSAEGGQVIFIET